MFKSKYFHFLRFGIRAMNGNPNSLQTIGFTKYSRSKIEAGVWFNDLSRWTKDVSRHSIKRDLCVTQKEVNNDKTKPISLGYQVTQEIEWRQVELCPLDSTTLNVNLEIHCDRSWLRISGECILGFSLEVLDPLGDSRHRVLMCWFTHIYLFFSRWPAPKFENWFVFDEIKQF